MGEKLKYGREKTLDYLMRDNGDKFIKDMIRRENYEIVKSKYEDKRYAILRLLKSKMPNNPYIHDDDLKIIEEVAESYMKLYKIKETQQEVYYKNKRNITPDLSSGLFILFLAMGFTSILYHRVEFWIFELIIFSIWLKKENDKYN